MKNFSFIVFTFLLFPLISCNKESIRGQGPIVTRTLSVSDFSSVEAHYDIDAVITYGVNAEVKVTGYENLLNILEPQVGNGVLRLKYNKHYNNVRNGNVRFEIVVPRVVGASTYGSGDIKVKSFVAGDDFTAGIYGSGEVTVENSAYQSATLDIYGSGKVEARGLQVRNALVNVYGSGHSYVSASERLITKIFGSGNVYYWGNPAIETTQNGSGRLIKR